MDTGCPWVQTDENILFTQLPLDELIRQALPVMGAENSIKYVKQHRLRYGCERTGLRRGSGDGVRIGERITVIPLLRFHSKNEKHPFAPVFLISLSAFSTFGLSSRMADGGRKKKRKGLILGVGLDSDGHKRLTQGPNFALIGGSEKTHEEMTEKAIKINEKLKQRGKELEEVSREEFDDIAGEVGLKRPSPK
jgi:hypothetical protein